MTATPGTIPALTQYGSGGLAIASTVAIEIVNTTDPDTAASYHMLLTDAVGKVPSVLSDTNPQTTDLFTVYRPGSGLPFSVQIGNLGIVAGNLPVGGSTGQYLQKLSGADFDATWVDLNIASSVAAGTAITASVSGTTVTIGVTDLGIGSGQLGTFAVVAEKIATGAVGTVQLANFAVLSTKIATGTITSTQLGTNSVGTVQLVDFAVTSSKVATNAIGAIQLATFGVVATSIATNAVGPVQLATFAVVATSIATGVVGSVQLAALAVQSSNLTSFAVFSSHIATGAVTFPKIQTMTGLAVLANASTATAAVSEVRAGGGARVLMSNEAATTLAFQHVTAMLSAGLGSTAGSLPYVSSGQEWTTLPPGATNGALLQVIGASLSYTSLTNNIDNTIGSTPGMILSRTTNSWVAIGGRVLLATLTPNNVASAVDTTSITSRYNKYIISFDSVQPISTANVTNFLAILVSTSAGVSWESSNYGCSLFVNQGSTNGDRFFNSQQIILTGNSATTGIGTAAGIGLSGEVVLYGAASSNRRKSFVGVVGYQSNGPTAVATTVYHGELFGFWNSNTAINGLSIAFNTGTISTGIIRIYGES